jgi:hypothetical protein
MSLPGGLRYASPRFADNFNQFQQCEEKDAVHIEIIPLATIGEGDGLFGMVGHLLKRDAIVMPRHRVSWPRAGLVR